MSLEYGPCPWVKSTCGIINRSMPHPICGLGAEKKMAENVLLTNLNYLILSKGTFNSSVSQEVLPYVRHENDKWLFPLPLINVEPHTIHDKIILSFFLDYCSYTSTVTIFHSTYQALLFIVPFNHLFLITVPRDILFKITPTHLWMYAGHWLIP